MSKKTNVWMPLYIADYLADTTRLTTEQHGAYLLLIMDYWRNGALPDDDGALANITRLTDAQWKKHRTALARLFQVENGEWRHKRIDNELERATANVEQRSAAGKASAAKRKEQREAQQKGNENPTDVATSVETEDERSAQQNSKPSPSPSLKTEPNGSSLRESARAHDDAAMTSCPADLPPTHSHRALALNLNLDLANELGMFLANARSKGRMSADWNAEFEVWLRRSRNFGNAKDQQPGTRQTVGKPLDEARRAAANTLGVGSQYLPDGAMNHAEIAD